MSHDPIDDAFQRRHELNIALSREYIAELESEVAALRAEVEGMREDAERWRFAVKYPRVAREVFDRSDDQNYPQDWTVLGFDNARKGKLGELEREQAWKNEVNRRILPDAARKESSK